MANLYLLPSGHPPSDAYQIYEQTYSLWHEIWFETLKQLDGVTSLASDGFTRQDFFAVATISNEVVALCCFKQADLRLSCHRQDSWFSPWPQALLEELAKTRSRTLIPSWLTVHPSYRRSNNSGGWNWSLVMSELISLVCLDVQAEVGFGTPRKDRSVNKMVSQAGAVCLKEDVVHHGVLIDLVAFYPENLRQVRFSSETTQLWKNKIDLRNKMYKPPVQMPQEFIERENSNETIISKGNGKPNRGDASPAVGE